MSRMTLSGGSITGFVIADNSPRRHENSGGAGQPYTSSMPSMSTFVPDAQIKDLAVDIEAWDSTTTGSSSDSSPIPVVRASTAPAGDFRSFAWYDVRCSYEKTAANGKKKEVEVLHGISGHLESGHMLAVLGPSGAGKSCLLDILADRKSVGRFESTRVVDGAPVSSSYFKAHSAYVTQEDTFHPTQSVMEAVMFQAHLRLDRRMGKEEKAALVSRLIDEVGLGGKEHQSVGGPLPGGLVIRGLSGGEKRRLSLCCGTITNPRLLFLDEPTSGLDSFAALVVMRLLHTYGKRGMMIVCTIHQPRPAIWALFDKVTVLSQGHLLYFGDACNAEPWFVHSLGYPRPANTSVVDFVLDLVSVNFNKDEEAIYGATTMRTTNDVASASEAFLASRHFADWVPPKPSDAPLRRNSSRYSLSGFTAALWWDEESSDRSTSPERPTLQPPHKAPLVPSRNRLADRVEALGLWWWQFRCVLTRNWTNCVRNPGNLLARSFLMVLIAFMQGFVYYKVGARERNSGSVLSVAHVLGSIYYTLFAVTILPFASLSLFIFDRRFYSGEAASKLYPCSAYYLANMALETFVSCINGSLYALIAYFLIDYPAFTQPPSILTNFAAYLAAIVVQTNTGSMILMLCALLSPNQDMAFTLAAGIDALALLTSGFIVPFPQFFGPAKWLQWTAHIKYTFQAMLINCFTGTKLYAVLPTLGLTSPGGVWVNLACSVGFYAAAFTLGYVCLANLYKERR